ncbi:MAG: GNAT family N-acetyltransferase [Oscillospiraceae bacterium]|nr:GNAT family N-acetyltransferase [Oscillospiraceae bacterium]
MGTVKCVESAGELGTAYNIRFKVFVDEQNVPVELELDEYDNDAVHMLALEGGVAVGCGRVVFFEGYAKIGRVAVLKEHRGRGHAKMICEKLIDIAREQGSRKAVLDSQCSAEGFYRKLGFEPEGEVFDDAGIEHVRMVKTL